MTAVLVLVIILLIALAIFLGFAPIYLLVISKDTRGAVDEKLQSSTYNHSWEAWNKRYSDSETVKAVTQRIRDPEQRESICAEVKKAFAHTKYWKNVVNMPEFQECFTDGGPYRGRRRSSIARDVLCANLGCVDCYANSEGYESALYSDNIKEREKEYEYVTTIHKILQDHGVDLRLQCVRDYKEAIYVLEGSLMDHADGRYFWFHDIVPFSHDLVEHPPEAPKRGFSYRDWLDAQKKGKCTTFQEAYQYVDQQKELQRLKQEEYYK